MARKPNDRVALVQAVRAALPSDEHLASGGTVTVWGDSGPPLFIHVSPATNPSDAVLADAEIFVVLEDPSNNVPPDERWLGEVFALTRAEQRIAAALVAGGTASTIAAEICRSEATVRWHIQRMKAKLKCRRLTELLLLFCRARVSVRGDRLPSD